MSTFTHKFLFLIHAANIFHYLWRMTYLVGKYWAICSNSFALGAVCYVFLLSVYSNYIIQVSSSEVGK